MSAMKELHDSRVDNATHAYLVAGLWSTPDHYATNDDGEYYPPLDENFGVEDIELSFMDKANDDLSAFILANLDDLGSMDDEQIGHDFWLTRAGHGAGFWDRGLGEAGDRLTDACRPYGDDSDTLNEAIIDEARIAATA